MTLGIMWTIGILIIFVVACVFLIPWSLEDALANESNAKNFMVTGRQVLALVTLGAIGGALGALRSQEPLQAPIDQFYLKLLVLFLRPAVGAAGGLALGLMQHSGVVSVLPLATPAAKWLIVLVVAFLGGFSERLFLGKLDQALTGEPKAEARDVDPSPAKPS